MEKLFPSYFQILHSKHIPQRLKEVKEAGMQHKIPIISDEVGFCLKILSALKKPKNLLEIGGGISYSTHWFLLGNNQTNIMSLEKNPIRASLAQEHLILSGFEKQTTVLQVAAGDFFKKNQKKFDMIFLDSAKKEYPLLLDPCVQNLRSGGVLIADNVFFRKLIWARNIDSSSRLHPLIEAIKTFNQKVTEHVQLEPFFMPIGDGLLIAIKK